MDDEIPLRLVPPVRANFENSAQSRRAMQTVMTIIGVLVVIGWVADQSLSDMRAILRSERRRFSARS